MSGGRRQKPPGQRLPLDRIDAQPPAATSSPKTAKRRRNDSRVSGGRQPLSPKERRLISALRVALAKKGIAHRKAGRIAGVDEGDACRVLAFGPATPRTLRKLFEAFNVNEYEKLSAADRREAMALEVHAAAERLADLLGKQAAMSAVGDPPDL